VGGLDLDHDAIVDDHVETLLAKLHAFVHHSDADLASHLVPSRQQLALESLEVQVLEEAVSKRVVNLEERTDGWSRSGLRDVVTGGASMIVAPVALRTIIVLLGRASKRVRREVGDVASR
jgi:hypothetical protein